MQDLLKKFLGQAQLLYEEMVTILCDCEALINSRPLTYVSESEHLVLISPSSFLQDIKEWSTPDIDAIDHKSLNRRIKYRQNLQKDLRTDLETHIWDFSYKEQNVEIRVNLRLEILG
ncbi:hypothetical protein AVEN_125646-1 [Araneus ventricosus]|uniref:Uncharacterized protein n=1 Tax=Araneus ventricosus TaxID=182803 RepID=A0A4Y2N960_ARAVE|nr:hypothetical protein AVEN_125646-1 [Araneus ventricosus]